MPRLLVLALALGAASAFVPAHIRAATPLRAETSEGESMDLVKALDQAYPDSPPLWPPVGVDRSAVDAMVGSG